MKALHVYSGNLYGGVETLLVALARHRSFAPRLEPRFALCFEGQLSQELEQAGCVPSWLGSVRISYPWSVLRARARLSKLLRAESMDAVICHSPWACALFGFVARKRGVPLVLWLHDAITGEHWLERWAIRMRPDFVIFNSRFVQERCSLIFNGVPSEVLYCPVSAPPVFAATHRERKRRELGVPNDARLIVLAARLQPWKGQRLLLRALGRLASLPGWQALIVGGPQRQPEHAYLAELQRLARSLGIVDRVRFVGHRSDVPEILAACDIHCQPNETPEPFGITWIEALHAGLRVVTTDQGGAREILDGGVGVLVPPGDVAALVQALRLEIEHAGPRDSDAGPARARKLCDPEARISQLNEIVSQVRAESADRRSPTRQPTRQQ